jgi:hypothetical protein
VVRWNVWKSRVHESGALLHGAEEPETRSFDRVSPAVKRGLVLPGPPSSLVPVTSVQKIRFWITFSRAPVCMHQQSQSPKQIVGCCTYILVRQNNAIKSALSTTFLVACKTSFHSLACFPKPLGTLTRSSKCDLTCKQGRPWPMIGSRETSC